MGKGRYIAVSGDAEVAVLPDRAVLTLGVEHRDVDQATAQQRADNVVSEILKLCDNLEIPAAHISTTQLYIQPEYDWNNKTRKRKLVAYLVRRSLEINLDDLARLGTLMEQATALGINQSSGPRFECSRKREIKRQALQEAVTDARLNAQAAASALNAGIGNVRSIRTTNLLEHPSPRGVRPEMLRSAAAKSDDGSADTYNVAEIRISAEVAVEFDLLCDA